MWYTTGSWCTRSLQMAGGVYLMHWNKCCSYDPQPSPNLISLSLSVSLSLSHMRLDEKQSHCAHHRIKMRIACWDRRVLWIFEIKIFDSSLLTYLFFATLIQEPILYASFVHVCLSPGNVANWVSTALLFKVHVRTMSWKLKDQQFWFVWTHLFFSIDTRS